MSLKYLQSAGQGEGIGGAGVSIDNAWLANCDLDWSTCRERKRRALGNEWICVHLDRRVYMRR